MTPEEVYAHETDPNVVCDIKGHLPFLRAEAHGVIVEIGVRGGASTSALLLGIREQGGYLYSIDINAACGTDIFDPNPQWTFIHGHSKDNKDRILRGLPLYYDVLFIDADHSYEAVISDLETYGPRVRKGGVILLHDTELEGAGVRQAISDYCLFYPIVPEFHTGDYGLGVLRV